MDWGGMGTAGARGELAASIVYAAVSEAKLAVREVTLAISVALFSICCVSVVHSVEAAAAKLSR